MCVATGWDMDAFSPWRRLMPKSIFLGFNTKASSKLFITSARIVLIREIDPWRETSDQMTPLGIPNAAAKKVDLQKLKESGAREFCEVHTSGLSLVSAKRYTRRGSMIDMRLLGEDGNQYAVSYWKTDGKDDKILGLIESQFGRQTL